MKRLLSVVMAVFLMLAIFPTSAAALSVTSIVVVGDTIVFLPSPQKVMTVNSIALLPASALADALGVTYKVNADKTVTLRKGSTFITYLGDDVVRTADKQLGSGLCIFEGSTPYLQADVAASNFGRIFTLLSGGIPRIKTRNFTYYDTEILRIINTMPLRSDYEVNSPEHYICFVGISDFLSRQLKAVSAYKATAVFFLTEKDILNNPADVLAIIAHGCSIGLMPSATFESGSQKSSSSFIKEFDRINVILQKLTRSTATMVMFQPDSSYNTNGMKNALLKAGYRLWKPNLLLPESNFSTYPSATLLSMIEKILPRIKWNSMIYVRNTANVTDCLADLLSFMKKSAYGISPATDTASSVYFTTIND